MRTPTIFKTSTFLPPCGRLSRNEETCLPPRFLFVGNFSLKMEFPVILLLLLSKSSSRPPYMLLQLSTILYLLFSVCRALLTQPTKKFLLRTFLRTLLSILLFVKKRNHTVCDISELDDHGLLPGIDNQFEAQGYIFPSCFELDDIENKNIYYAVLSFVRNISKHLFRAGGKTTGADAAHFQGTGLQSYVTTFEVVIQDANNHIFRLHFSHSVGSECIELCRPRKEHRPGLQKLHEKCSLVPGHAARPK